MGVVVTRRAGNRYRLRLSCGGPWIEGTWTATTRAEAETIAGAWAARWMRDFNPARFTITDGAT